MDHDESAESAEELKARTRELDDQVRRMVRTEQQLYHSQRALSRQMARVDALNRFALAASRAEEPEILRLAAETVFSAFSFDQAIALVREPSGALRVRAVHAMPGREPPAPPGELEVAVAPAELVLGRAEALRARADVAPLLEALDAVFGSRAEETGHAEVAVLPLHGERGGLGGVLALRRVDRFLSFHEQLPGPEDAPFLDLVARHVSAAASNARLVADVRESYAALARAQQELVRAERLAALGEMSAVVAHEVRNPLAVIFNAIGGMRRELLGDPAMAPLLAIVSEEASRINRIVGDLLEFARPSPPRLARESLEKVVAEAVESACSAVAAHAASVAVEGAPLPEVPLDARMVRQAVLNLVVNSLQATRDGTPVVVRLAQETIDPSAYARVDVIDRGQGIASGDLERIFQPFFTTKATGTGLGLAVVKRAVDAHGGKLRVRSSPGVGSTFSILLPLGRAG